METTLNIHSEILKKINAAAEKHGISRSALILLLIKKAMDDFPNPDNIGKLIRYQRKSEPEDWHVFHIKVRMDDYEYFLDLRKLLKMSVSLILAFMVEKYLFTHNRLCVTDNNRYINYMIVREVIDNIICWRLVWGYPINLKRIIRI